MVGTKRQIRNYSIYIRIYRNGRLRGQTNSRWPLLRQRIGDKIILVASASSWLRDLTSMYERLITTSQDREIWVERLRENWLFSKCSFAIRRSLRMRRFSLDFRMWALTEQCPEWLTAHMRGGAIPFRLLIASRALTNTRQGTNFNENERATISRLVICIASRPISPKYWNSNTYIIYLFIYFSLTIPPSLRSKQVIGIAKVKSPQALKISGKEDTCSLFTAFVENELHSLIHLSKKKKVSKSVLG